MSKHADIIARLEKAEGASEELGVLIKCALLAPDGAYVEQSKLNYAWCIYYGEHNGQPRLWEYRGVSNELRLSDPTASIDASIALVERMLPGWRVENLCEWESETLRNRGAWTCDLRENGHDFFSGGRGKCPHAPTPALALLVALFRALDAQETSK